MTTKQTTSKRPKVAAKTDVSHLVDRLAEIEQQLNSIDARALLRESDAIKSELRDMIKAPERDSVTVAGSRAVVEFGPCPIERVVYHKGRLKKLLGTATFDKIAKFTLKDLGEFINETQIASVVQEVYGKRRVTSIISTGPTVH